ncbi:MAG: hypothetical protein RRY36_07955 [Bacteroidaceae bacterium]
MGVNPETADMYRAFDGNPYFITYTLKVKEDCCKIREDDVPAWSLSQLISLMPSLVTHGKKGNKPYHLELIKDESGYVITFKRYAADYLVGVRIKDDPIECCVSMIEWLINNNHFNKEYLK